MQILVARPVVKRIQLRAKVQNHLVNIPPQTNQLASQNETLQLSSIVTPSNRDSSNKIRSGPPLQTSQVPTSKRQRVIGMLGIELNEDALKISDKAWFTE